MKTIDLYTWPTPNGHKIHIMMEETGTPYRVIPVDIGKGEQFKPDFLKISPNNKMPAMVDPDGPGGKPFALAESGAMLFYLASKTGRFLPQDVRDRWEVMHAEYKRKLAAMMQIMFDKMPDDPLACKSLYPSIIVYISKCLFQISRSPTLKSILNHLPGRF